MYTKSEVINLIDLTSLNDTDKDKNIIDLCHKAKTSLGDVASICIYKQFISLAKKHLDKNIPITTVINFPKGNQNLKDTLLELEDVLTFGADEIDLVMPYHLVAQNQLSEIEYYVHEVRNNSIGKVLKVIIESGELAKEEYIRIASKISIDCGVDFIKTSTGKVNINATLESAKIMLEEIKKSGTNCGFKAAGGVKTYEESIEYLSLAKNIMGDSYINKKTFRFGDSSLLNNLIDQKSESSY